ncbi:helix-turn-helix domain-containing protein [Kineosporia sp. R_H_3]|uniref:helix-turn-helix domain-containing protein n=1 Tax=Kineosporia sp. R_H_3 TaxID=1961848 RepID=UPI000B4BCF7A|nr:cupin domain-containing protein [Kineosporia sp. R_H_3]
MTDDAVQNASDQEGTDPVPQVVGRRVRAARTAKSWTLDRLAEQSGVSRRMIVNVEAGSSNASIAILLRLARALNISLAELVSDTSPAHDVTVSTADTRTPLWHGRAGGSAVLTASADTPDMLELWDWTLGPDEVYDSEPHRAGTRELLHVLTGHVRLTIDGHTHDLRTGAAASFPGDVPHGYANAGRRPARFSLTVFEPRTRVRP